MKTFTDWCSRYSHVLGDIFAFLAAEKAWNARSAIADAREAELRAEIDRLKAERDALRERLDTVTPR